MYSKIKEKLSDVFSKKDKNATEGDTKKKLTPAQRIANDAYHGDILIDNEFYYGTLYQSGMASYSPTMHFLRRPWERAIKEENHIVYWDPLSGSRIDVKLTPNELAKFMVINIENLEPGARRDKYLSRTYRVTDFIDGEDGIYALESLNALQTHVSVTVSKKVLKEEFNVIVN